MAQYRSHKRKVDKWRRISGWKSALNNPSTSKGGRQHARNQLIIHGHILDAFTSTSLDTRFRRIVGLRAKKRS